MTELPLVSIIIPTQNAARYLAKCLESVANQTYKQIEVIVVDRQSTDATKEIAHRSGAKVLDFGHGRSAQVNFGVKNANGKYVYRVDADFVLQPKVVEEAVRVCEEQGFEAVAVHNTSDPTISFWSKVRNLERNTYKYDELIVAARFFRKDVFEKLGGFDESLIAAEDYDLHNRVKAAGYRVGRIEPEEWHIGEPKHLSEIFRSSFFYGGSILGYLKKNPGRGLQQSSPFRPSFIKHWRDFASHPLLTLGFVVMGVTKIVGLVLGLLWFSLKRLVVKEKVEDKSFSTLTK
ncbi:MAG: glycosyltransferase [bacterium]|nr:glycosyltransferase [bacterium]